MISPSSNRYDTFSEAEIQGGTIHLTYWASSSVGNYAASGDIRYHAGSIDTTTGNVTWTTVADTLPILATKYPSFPDLAVGNDGSVHIVWHEEDASTANNGVGYGVFDGTDWVFQSLADTTGTVEIGQDIVVSAQDNVYVTWGDSAAGGIVLVNYTSEGWSPVTLLLADGFTWTDATSLAIDHNGQAVAAFSASVGNVLHYFSIQGTGAVGTATKRYFAGGQQVATRAADGTLFYHVNDPSGTSLLLLDENGDEAGQMVYDGFGGVLTSTMPPAVSGTLPGLPDAVTGLVHLGDGRWYDPTLGRPLQPNPAGGPPTVPQALNRYTATPLGQPGVSVGEYQSLQQFLLDTTKGETREGILGIGVGIGVSSQLYGTLSIKANNAVLSRAGYQGLFNQTASLGRGRGALYESVLVSPIGNRRFGVKGSSDLVIDLNLLESKVSTSQWGVSFPRGQAFSSVDDTVFKRFIGTEFGSELFTGTIIEVAFGIPELIEPWQNPYFSPGQRLTQNFVTGAGIAAQAGVGAYVGTLVGGPVGFAVGVGVGVGVGLGYAWEYGVKPGVSWIFTSLGRNDPYQEIRHLQPLGAN